MTDTRNHYEFGTALRQRQADAEARRKADLRAEALDQLDLVCEAMKWLWLLVTPEDLAERRVKDEYVHDILMMDEGELERFFAQLREELK